MLSSPSNTPMDDATRLTLVDVAETHGTPSYVYFAEPLRARVRELHACFGQRFASSYAAKANPAPAVLSLFAEAGIDLDVSSGGELERGLAAGFDASRIGFTGPAKREEELALAVERRIGHVVCESVDEMVDVNRLAVDAGTVQPVLLRVNPLDVGRGFGLRMGGQPSQFGIDEEQMPEALGRLTELTSLRCDGLHAYPAGNSLSVDAVAGMLVATAELYARLCTEAGFEPRRLVFGSGFGIPYFEGDVPLDTAEVAARTLPELDRLCASGPLANARCSLELGRWLVGEAGWLLTSIVRAKRSRGREIRICDAGFNDHLSAAGMMGTVMRRDWRFENLELEPAPAGGEVADDGYLVTGPLCASFDVLGNAVPLARAEVGDVLAIASSGAYGLTASPTRFISHPEPTELMVDGERIVPAGTPP